MMDRRKQLMAGGGIAVAAILGVGVLAGSVGVFGLSDDPPRVGKLSPIDSTRTTTVTTPNSDDDTPLGSTPGATVGTTPNTAPSAVPSPSPNTTPNTLGSPPTTTVTAPGVDDHGGDRVGDDNSGPGSGGDDNSGPGSSNSGHGGGGSGSGRDHPEDD